MSDLDSVHDYFTPAKAPAFSSHRRPQTDSLLEEHSTELPSGENEQALQMMEEALEIMNVRHAQPVLPPKRRHRVSASGGVYQRGERQRRRTTIISCHQECF